MKAQSIPSSGGQCQVPTLNEEEDGDYAVMDVSEYEELPDENLVYTNVINTDNINIVVYRVFYTLFNCSKLIIVNDFLEQYSTIIRFLSNFHWNWQCSGPIKNNVRVDNE